MFRKALYGPVALRLLVETNLGYMTHSEQDSFLARGHEPYVCVWVCVCVAIHHPLAMSKCVQRNTTHMLCFPDPEADYALKPLITCWQPNPRLSSASGGGRGAGALTV